MSSGLLGMMGGFDDPKTLGLLGMAAPLLQAGGYSQTPVSLGQALGAGMQGGVNAYAQGTQAQQAAKMRALQIAQMERDAKAKDDMASGMDAFFLKPPASPTMQNASLKSPAESAGLTPVQIQFAQSLPAEQRATYIQQILSKDMSPIKVGKDERLVDARDPTKVLLNSTGSPNTEVAKLNDDLQAGRITQAQYSAALAKLQSEGGFVYGMGPNGPTARFIAGGPQDPGTITRNAFASGYGNAPFQNTPLQPGAPVVNNMAMFRQLYPNGLPNPGPGLTAGEASATGASAGSGMPGFSQPFPGMVVPQAPVNGTQEALDKKSIDAYEQLTRLNNISEGFKPEYLNIGNRFGAEWQNIREKAGAKLTPEQSAYLRDFSTFRRDAVSNINRTLNELSGAAVSDTEQKRLLSELPNPGLGMFDGDGPTVFKAKLDRATDGVRNATMRYAYAKNNGLDPLKIPLDEVPALIRKRGEAIADEVKKANPGASDDLIKNETTLRVRREFGMLR